MRVNKCDWCGKYYDVNDAEKQGRQAQKEAYSGFIFTRYFEDPAFGGRHVHAEPGATDLCDDCIKAIFELRMRRFCDER